MELVTSALRLTCLQEKSSVIGFNLDVRDGEGWSRLATTTPLSHLIYQDNAKNRQETDLCAEVESATETVITLKGAFTDVDGVEWSLAITFALTDSPNRIQADYQLSAAEGRQVLRWLGPCLYAGEGAFGSQKDAALFPGLEYLLGDEVSSDTVFAAPKYANRVTPSAYKITVPMMAVSHAGKAVGMIWDMNQTWGSYWRHPTALFSSPNRLQENANNHWMALFAPSVEPRWLKEGDIEAHTPFGISPGKPATLSAQLVGLPDGDVIDVLRQWVAVYGMPPMPQTDHDYYENIDLCIESYLDVAWDDAGAGWHHTLADPWQPRFEPILANQLWRYSRWPQGDSIWKARAREQIHRAIPRMQETLPPPHNVPHLDLALVYGKVVDALDGMAQAARELIETQQKNGSWGWTPDTVADIADFKTEDRLQAMGLLEDSATGLTGSRVRPVLKYALATGDAAAVASLKSATDWCNTQGRPEGAQTWELHLHVPDVLAVPYLIDMNVAVYQLTGDANYLDYAEQWAWTGLPFTFLWNGYYRPIMRYGTVPVFGVTFHDVQSWFGVIVHWNGLWYADSLFRLAQFRQGDDLINWSYLAEAITRHGMQEQAKDGPVKGFYPDAFSPVKGDEEYTWWLNPQLIGLNSFPLAGIPVRADSVVQRIDGDPVYITSGATVEQVQIDDKLRIVLRDFAGETSYTLLAGKRPTAIVCDGETLPETDDLDTVAQGWRWLSEHNAALIKTHYAHGGVVLSCAFV